MAPWVSMRESESKFPINTRSVLRISALFVHPDTLSTGEQQEEQQEEQPEHTSQESLVEEKPVERSKGGEERNQKVLPSSSSCPKGLLCKHRNLTNPNSSMFTFFRDFPFTQACSARSIVVTVTRKILNLHQYLMCPCFCLCRSPGDSVPRLPHSHTATCVLPFALITLICGSRLPGGLPPSSLPAHRCRGPPTGGKASQ